MSRYGIYNKHKHCFQFRISAGSALEAKIMLYNKIGRDASKKKFVAKKLPERKAVKQNGNDNY